MKPKWAVACPDSHFAIGSSDQDFIDMIPEPLFFLPVSYMWSRRKNHFYLSRWICFLPSTTSNPREEDVATATVSMKWFRQSILLGLLPHVGVKVHMKTIPALWIVFPMHSRLAALPFQRQTVGVVIRYKSSSEDRKTWRSICVPIKKAEAKLTRKGPKWEANKNELAEIKVSNYLT